MEATAVVVVPEGFGQDSVVTVAVAHGAARVAGSVGVVEEDSAVAADLAVLAAAPPAAEALAVAGRNCRHSL